jgi:FtsZ-binding cell division protein ZapB
VDNCDTRHDGADSAMTKTLMLMLVDEVREVKEENRQLRDRVAELRGQRKRDRAEMRAMENRLQNMEQSMQAMATAQRESAVQMTRLFQQKPLPPSRHATSAPQPSSASLMTGSLTTTSSSTTITPAALSSLPQSFDSPPRQSSSFAGSVSPAYSMSARMHGLAGLLHALPYLRDFDPGLLIVSDLRYTHLP